MLSYPRYVIMLSHVVQSLFLRYSSRSTVLARSTASPHSFRSSEHLTQRRSSSSGHVAAIARPSSPSAWPTSAHTV